MSIFGLNYSWSPLVCFFQRLGLVEGVMHWYPVRCPSKLFHCQAAECIAGKKFNVISLFTVFLASFSVHFQGNMLLGGVMQLEGECRGPAAKLQVL